MTRLRCWLAHRAYWTVISPGRLPLLLAARRWCPFCSRPPRRLAFDAGYGAA